LPEVTGPESGDAEQQLRGNPLDGSRGEVLGVEAPKALDADGSVSGLLQFSYFGERTGVLHDQPCVIHGFGVIYLQCFLEYEDCLVWPVFFQKACHCGYCRCGPRGRVRRVCRRGLEYIDLASDKAMAKSAE
jgi:hypothetical protein